MRYARSATCRVQCIGASSSQVSSTFSIGLRRQSPQHRSSCIHELRLGRICAAKPMHSLANHVQVQSGQDSATKRAAALEARCAGLQADALRAAALDRRCGELQQELTVSQQVCSQKSQSS